MVRFKSKTFVRTAVRRNNISQTEKESDTPLPGIKFINAALSVGVIYLTLYVLNTIIGKDTTFEELVNAIAFVAFFRTFENRE
jgi:hypothetical protein